VREREREREGERERMEVGVKYVPLRLQLYISVLHDACLIRVCVRMCVWEREGGRERGRVRQSAIVCVDM